VQKRLTTTSYALLGLMALKPWTTYELAKQVQRGLGWFWPRAERKLYEEPKHLVEAGYATATEEYTGNRPRTVYAITRAGRKALRSWLGEEAQAPTLEFEGLVKVFFADGGSLEQLHATLDTIATQAVERIAELRVMIEAGADPSYEFAERLPINALALRFELDHQALLARWARWAKRQTASWRSTTDSNDWDWHKALAGDAL
jgi:PadR family transcriptional regulator, regulatory protein AphA